VVAVLAVLVLGGVVVIVGGMTRSGHPASPVGAQRPAGAPVGSSGTAAFDVVLADAGIRAVLCNIRTPR
jgi:hypothetical protein